MCFFIELGTDDMAEKITDSGLKYEDLVEGRPGPYHVRLMDNHVKADCAYPGVEVLPDGTFVTTTYGHWTPGESPYVVSVRFDLKELDAVDAAP